VKETLKTSQRFFYSLDLNANSDFGAETHDGMVQQHSLDVAESDGSLRYVGSTYSPDNDAIHDGILRQGMRIVTFRPILRDKLIPLPQVIDLLLDMGVWGMGTPVEIEFALNLSSNSTKTEFALLQMRPMVIHREPEVLKIVETDRKKILCESKQVLGHGIIQGIHDIVAVDYYQYDRTRSSEVAQEIAAFNSHLNSSNRPYLLIGVGRWGSLDPSLGIPVSWEQISGARAIVETGFRDMSVIPSQGSHFFQNITSFMIGYFTVDEHKQNGFVDWDWLSQQSPMEQKKHTKLLRFDKPIIIRINGHQNKGIILKPDI
jgi:hypothetical protein